MMAKTTGTRNYKLLTIPRRRRRDKIWTIFYICGLLLYFTVFFLFIFFAYSSKELRINRTVYWATTFTYALLAACVGELLVRFGHLIGEQRYLSTRYNNQVCKLCRKIYFQYGLRFWIILFVCAAALVTIYFGYKKENILWIIFQDQWFVYLTWIIIRGTLIPLLCLDVSYMYHTALRFCPIILLNWFYKEKVNIAYVKGLTPVQSSTVPDSNTLNCGHGLAWTYYLEYLQIILPALPDRISNTEWWHSEKGRMVAKLFILMPETCETSGSINELDPLVKFIGTTKPIYANRAGNIQRPYTVSVYSSEIPEKQKKFYGAVEFAWPLHSLHEMSQCREARLTKGQMKEQMYIFYRTLSKILEKSPHAENVVLLPYKEKLPDGSKLLFSKLIAEAIEEEYRLYGKEWIF